MTKPLPPKTRSKALVESTAKEDTEVEANTEVARPVETDNPSKGEGEASADTSQKSVCTSSTAAVTMTTTIVAAQTQGAEAVKVTVHLDMGSWLDVTFAVTIAILSVIAAWFLVSSLPWRWQESRAATKEQEPDGDHVRPPVTVKSILRPKERLQAGAYRDESRRMRHHPSCSS